LPTLTELHGNVARVKTGLSRRQFNGFRRIPSAIRAWESGALDRQGTRWFWGLRAASTRLAGSRMPGAPRGTILDDDASRCAVRASRGQRARLASVLQCVIPRNERADRDPRHVTFTDDW